VLARNIRKAHFATRLTLALTLTNRMRVINYQPSYPTRRGNAEQLKIPVGLL